MKSFTLNEVIQRSLSTVGNVLSLDLKAHGLLQIRIALSKLFHELAVTCLNTHVS